MRKLIIVASLALALCGCAAPDSVRRQALSNCQSVGISEKEPQFASCMQAFRLQNEQDRLEQSYHDALTAERDDSRDHHPSIYVH
jgi:hypothetical protein